MTDWFRSWHGAPTDPKWLVIARKAGVVPGIVNSVVWALFDHASQQSERGSVQGFDVETYAAFSGFDESQVRAVISALEEKGIIANHRLASWEKRQPKREDGASERAKQWRERNRTQSNADERPDTDTDTEKKITTAEVVISARDPFLNPDDPFLAYSEGELDRLQIEFDAEDIRRAIPELWAWSGRKGVEKPNERKAMVWKALQNRRGASELIEAKQNAPPVVVSSELSKSRLVSRRH